MYDILHIRTSESRRCAPEAKLKRKAKAKPKKTAAAKEKAQAQSENAYFVNRWLLYKVFCC